MRAEAESMAPVANDATRPLLWSIRREMWENRAIVIAPAIIAACLLFGYLISMIRLPHKMRALAALDLASQRASIARPYSLFASVILMTGVIVAVFYCLDALHGERRDRSLLFWKSLPVSDRTAVLAKIAIPLVVQPLVGFVIAHLVQAMMLMLSTAVLLANGMSPAIVWRGLPLLQMPLVMAYGLAVHALWHAPLYAWLLLVSAWAKRATFLWAVMPFLALYVVERFAIGTSHTGSLLRYRVIGAMSLAFGDGDGRRAINRLAQLEPLQFLGSPGLWLGLLFAAACLLLAIRLRRVRQPM